jgi:hypothetical protein
MSSRARRDPSASTEALSKLCALCERAGGRALEVSGMGESMETRERIAGILGCTSNREAKAAGRSETRKGGFLPHDAFVADEP